MNSLTIVADSKWTVNSTKIGIKMRAAIDDGGGRENAFRENGEILAGYLSSAK